MVLDAAVNGAPCGGPLAVEEKLMATTRNDALRLLSLLKAEAEKVAALRTDRYFEEHAKRADLEAFDHFLETAGDEPPRPGDEILTD
jgi:hypothetical protein